MLRSCGVACYPPVPMTPEQLKRHRAILAAHKALLDEEEARSRFSIPAEQFEVIRHDIESFQAECPGVVPPFDSRLLIVNRMGKLTMVGLAPLRSYLARALAVLETMAAAPVRRAETNRGFFSH